MAQGTIAVTNGSKDVAGTGTAFNGIAPGSFLTLVIGNVPYTVAVDSVQSDTSLTLVSPFDGPTSSGLAFDVTSPQTMALATMGVTVQAQKALRMMISDESNWRSIYSNASSVTVSTPDGGTFTGPSWGYMANQYANTLKKDQNLADLPDKATSRTNLGVGYGTTAGTVAQGNDGRLNTVAGKSGGEIVGTVSVLGSSIIIRSPQQGSDGWASSLAFSANDAAKSELATIYTNDIGAITIVTDALSSPKEFKFSKTGNATAPGAWVPNSDERLKDRISRIDDPLIKMRELKGCTWVRKDTGLWGIGFIAQDVKRVFPEAVVAYGERKLQDGSVVKNVLSPDTYGVSAALHHEAILVLMDEIEKLKRQIDELKNS